MEHIHKMDGKMTEKELISAAVAELLVTEEHYINNLEYLIQVLSF
jgi:hypothetical protein